MGPVELPPSGRRAPGGRASGAGRGGGRLTLVSRGPGLQVGTRPWRGGALDVPATLRAGLTMGHTRPVVAALRERTRRIRSKRLVVFLLDASGSMGVRRRMEATKGAVLAAVARAYQRRDRVALITLRGSGASLVLPPTNSVAVARAVLAGLPTGGRTPLAAGLTAARDLIVAWCRRHPGAEALLVACSDGRANAGGADPLAEALAVAAGMARAGIEAVVVDTEEAGFRLGLAGRLAGALGAGVIGLDELRARGGRLATSWVNGGVARGRAV